MAEKKHLFESRDFVDGITIIVYKTDYALTCKNFDKNSIKTPTVIYVSDKIHASSFASKISYDCSFNTNFSPIAGCPRGFMSNGALNETFLSFEDIDGLCAKGFNPLRFIASEYSFYIWHHLILEAFTENGEAIKNIPDYRAYRWAMAPKKTNDKWGRFEHLIESGIIEIRNGGFSFRHSPVLYRAPKGISMVSGNGYPMVI